MRLLSAPSRKSSRAAAAALFALLALQLDADVFWRIPRRADTALQELGGSCVYATDVQINGAPGALSTYVFADSAARVSASLTRRFGLAVAAERGGAFITCAEKGRVTRFLVLPAASGEESCVALAISQTASDASSSRRTPAAWPEGMPALAGIPLFSAVCTATRTAFVTAETEASPEAAVQEAALALQQAGWTESVPSAPTFRILASGRKTCLLIATRDEKTGRATISVLQREGSTP